MSRTNGNATAESDSGARAEAETSRRRAPAEPRVSLDELDDAFASLRISYGIAHAISLALQAEEQDTESLSYALEFVHETLGKATETLQKLDRR